MKKIISKLSAAVLSAVLAGSFGAAEYYSKKLPEGFTAEAGAPLGIAGYPLLSMKSDGADSAAVTFLGAIPVKNVAVRQEEAPVLTVGGSPFGIKLLMEGVMVTSLGSVAGADGSRSCPAEDAGIAPGDVIRLADGKPVSSNADMQSVISSSGGEPVELSVRRGDRDITTQLKPVCSAEGVWRGGMWVRDSIAGIGTITFIRKEDGAFAGLGHPVCDSDTGEAVPVHSGEAVPVEITDARRGIRGIPGELRGTFLQGASYGILTDNCESGVCGRLTHASCRELCRDPGEYKLAYRQEISPGKAQIRTTVTGGEPELYDAEIERIDYSGGPGGKDMVIRITDPELLSVTGGIVQGMSGSPIIQDGRIAGAVTHVFVSDPARGYGIFAETMLEAMEGA